MEDLVLYATGLRDKALTMSTCGYSDMLISDPGSRNKNEFVKALASNTRGNVRKYVKRLDVIMDINYYGKKYLNWCSMSH